MQGRNDPPRRATSAGVARWAGVSRTTVSFVLNDTPHQSISTLTRRRVLEAAQHLSYAPSAEARSLSRGHSSSVLLYLPPARALSEDIGKMIEQLSVLFAHVGLSMVIHAWTRGPAAQVWSSVTPAAVLAWDLRDDDAEHMRHNGVLGVVSWTGSDAMGRWITGAREEGIVRLQVERLTRAGHRHLVYAVTGGDHMHDAAQWRYEVLRRECASLQLPEPTVLHVPADPHGPASPCRRGGGGESSGIGGVRPRCHRSAGGTVGHTSVGLDCAERFGRCGRQRFSDRSACPAAPDHGCAGHGHYRPLHRGCHCVPCAWCTPAVDAPQQRGVDRGP